MGLESDRAWQDMLYDLGLFGQDWLAVNRAGCHYASLRWWDGMPAEEARNLSEIDKVVAGKGWTRVETDRLLAYIEKRIEEDPRK